MTNYRRPVTVTLLSGALLALLALLAGCQPIIPKPGAVTTAPVAETAVATEAVATEAVATEAVATEAAAADIAAASALSADEQLVATAAAEQVAQTANVAVGDVRLISMEAVEWPDASLGCPQPDMMYAQVITPGYRLIFDAGGQNVEVHTDMQQSPQIVICKP